MAVDKELALAALRTLVTRITIDSNLTEEPIVIDKPFEDSGQPSTVSRVLEFVQPVISLRLGEAQEDVVIAPAGKPTRKGQVAAAKTGAAIAGVIGGGGLLWLLLKNKG